MKKLIVHIGRPKTGTTAIQRFLMANRLQLNRAGLQYARSGMLRINHLPLAWSIFKQVCEQGQGDYWEHARHYAVLDRSADAYWNDLREEIERSEFDTFLISAEELGVEWHLEATTALFAQYVDGIEVDIVVYFRRQDEFLQSLYNEAVKGKESRFAGDFWDYVQPILDHRGADCLQIIRPWARVVGEDHMRVRVYEREQLPRGLYADFMQTLGLELSADWSVPKGNPNPPLKPWALDVLRRLNRYQVLRPLHGVFADTLKLIGTERGAHAAHRMLSPDIRRELYARFADSNAVVARKYLGREDGRLFYSQPAGE